MIAPNSDSPDHPMLFASAAALGFNAPSAMRPMGRTCAPTMGEAEDLQLLVSRFGPTSQEQQHSRRSALQATSCGLCSGRGAADRARIEARRLRGGGDGVAPSGPQRASLASRGRFRGLRRRERRRNGRARPAPAARRPAPGRGSARDATRIPPARRGRSPARAAGRHLSTQTARDYCMSVVNNTPTP